LKTGACLHVAQISFFSDPQGRLPQLLLTDWPSLADIAECTHGAGVRVSVIQASTHSHHVSQHGIDYYFLPPGRNFFDLLISLAPDVLHVHGLDFGRDVLTLAAALPRVPILLQDHASGLPRPWRRSTWRRGVAKASGVAFCSIEQARPFVAAGLLAPGMPVYEIPESTSRFVPGDRRLARQSLGATGDPLILMVGHLNANKDPLTVLEGVSRAAQLLPQLQLYCCYGAAPLLNTVRRRIAGDPLLIDRVHLVGRVAHVDVERWMRAADIFVSGSHREGSGYALIEALACGLPSVVTDIPSFRALTGAGSAGTLWPAGKAGALCGALISVAARPQSLMRPAIRCHYENELSFAAVGRKLAAVYESLEARRRVRSSSSHDPDALTQHG
jgi:glycosyltransferase involved in cell wall biosynthesis